MAESGSDADPVATTVEELRRALGDEALARVTPRLRDWQDALEREWAALPARLAVAPRGRGTGWLLERWLAEREAVVRATPVASEEDRALARLELATLEGLEARLRAQGVADEEDASPKSAGRPESDRAGATGELAQYVLTLEGREAPLGNLVALLELWNQIVARGARGDAALMRFAEPRLRRGPANGEASVVFEGTPALVAELRSLLGRMGAREDASSG